jgi:hypothetical protein
VAFFPSPSHLSAHFAKEKASELSQQQKARMRIFPSTTQPGSSASFAFQTIGSDTKLRAGNQWNDMGAGSAPWSFTHHWPACRPLNGRA